MSRRKSPRALRAPFSRTLQIESLEDRALLNGSNILADATATVQAGTVSSRAVIAQNTEVPSGVAAELAYDNNNSNELVGDVDGDGREDIIHRINGEWSVSQSRVGGIQCQWANIDITSVAELPRECVDSAIAAPLNKTPIFVAEGDDLQAAFDNAVSGDIIELEAGATFRGNFKLGPKAGDEWIHIRSSRHAELPPSGVRIDPAKHADLMPKIVSSGAGSLGRALDIQPGAHHYRFEGIEVTSDFSRTDDQATNLIVLGAFQLESEDQLAHHIIFDRMYVHGNPTGSVLNGIRIDGRHVAVVDSYISDFHAIGRESHAVYAADGAGPLKITNNYLEAAGVNVLFGGDDPYVDGLINEDIEIRGNHFSKQAQWRTGPAVHKFLLEFKNARRILVSENVLENAWPDGRFGEGTGILIKSVNQDGACTWCVAEDVTVSHNILRNIGIGVKISGHTDYPSDRAEKIVIENNLFYNSDPEAKTNGFILLEDYDSVYLVHNTTVIDGPSAIVLGSNYSPSLVGLNLTVRDNLLSHNLYGVKGDGKNGGTSSLDTWVKTYEFDNNVLFGGEYMFPSQNPDGNDFVDQVDFVDPDNGDFRLSSTSPFNNAASDGTDIGVNFERLDRTLCAETGDCRELTTTPWGVWSSTVKWEDVHVADVNGDGRDDVIGRANGHWWVSKSMGTHFINEHWGRWSETVDWKDIHVADVNGDGKDDVVGRANGHWWVGKSNGEYFTNEHWSKWSNTIDWQDVLIADVDNNGTDDILGRENGRWWVSRITDGAVATQLWSRWAVGLDWHDVQAADVNGDGFEDIVGRANGHWWISVSQGATGIGQHWGSWSPGVDWTHVQVTDVNGDGKDDIVGRANERSWWVAVSNDNKFESTYWGDWLIATTLETVRTNDINGDGKDDLVALVGGEWETAISGENAYIY